MRSLSTLAISLISIITHIVHISFCLFFVVFLSFYLSLSLFLCGVSTTFLRRFLIAVVSLFAHWTIESNRLRMSLLHRENGKNRPVRGVAITTLILSLIFFLYSLYSRCQFHVIIVISSHYCFFFTISLSAAASSFSYTVWWMKVNEFGIETPKPTKQKK